MQQLIDGYQIFRSTVFPQKQTLYRQLAGGQSPSTLFITCSDSRVQPNEFISAGPGELFWERSVGNIIPEGESPETEARAVIEYAVVALGVSDIVVCGHSDCGAMKALLNPASLAALPSVKAWLDNAGPVLENVRRKHGPLQGLPLLDATIRENVLVQLDHLRTIPFLGPRLADGRVKLHGWVYDLGLALVFAHDPRVDQFLPLREAYA